MSKSPDTSMNLDLRRRRLLYRARHRGTREMDLLMGSFCETILAELDEGDIVEFERLIDIPDQQLYLWISEPSATPPELRSPLLDRLRASRAHRADNL